MRGIYKDIGSGIETVADQNTSLFNPPVTYDAIAFNDENVAFTFGGNDGIAVESGSGFNIVADQSTLVPESTGTFTEFIEPSFDGQNVAFRGLGQPGTFGAANRLQGIYTDEGGTLRRIVDFNTLIPGTTDAFRGLRTPRVADGNTAFQAVLPLGNQGVFIEFDGMLSKVIATGDLLFGQQVTLVELASKGTFGNNAVGFFAGLADGTFGIYRADLTPLETDPPGTSVPEPGSALLLGLSLAGLVAATWRRRKGKATSI